MAYETWIGLRYLQSRKRTHTLSILTLISIVGVTLGVATLSTVLSVMNGFQKELISKVIGVNAHGILFRYGVNFRDYEDVQKRLLTIEGVESTSPIVLGEVMISAGRRMVGVGLKGINLTKPLHLASLERHKAHPAGKIHELLPPGPGELPGIAIGKALAEQLGVTLGDSVQVVSPISLFGLNYRPQASSRTFRVVYLFRFGMLQYDNKQVVVHLAQAQSFLNLKESVTGIEFLLKNAQAIGPIRKKMTALLGGWPYRIQDWRDMNKNLFKAIEENKIALTLVLLFIILVASLNIAGTMILMVVEKAKDIAILRTMGSDRKGIMSIFLTYGLYIGALGTMAGLSLGFFLCRVVDRIDLTLEAEVYFISRLPVEIRPFEFLFVGVAALLISFLATVYPAIQASRQKPVEILRYE